MTTTIEKLTQTIQDLEDFARTAAKFTNGSIEGDIAFRAQKAIGWLKIAVKSSGFELNSEVTLLQDVPCPDGWRPFAHDLKAGKRGIVLDIDFDEDCNPRVMFEPFDQTQIPERTCEELGIIAGVPVPRPKPYRFWVEGRYFKKTP